MESQLYGSSDMWMNSPKARQCLAPFAAVEL